ncbi:hypothetical protein [Micromonospora cremea]|uniref:META domain-containing protein n=1 Tax=Micromonospora cremea TaxID=709881 RepID=A0A1N6A479_9ACTN|nr:hypothetical protein [Micromonospora cremea]SIN28859.1 hypothetical protein SAMN04489832_4914 [Micromonospora cremea]
MGRSRFVVAVIVLGALLAGCGDGGGSQAPTPDRSRDSGAVDSSRVEPVGLIGNWTVTAPDPDSSGILRLAPVDQGGLSWFGTCGTAMGTWRADTNGLFLAGVPKNPASGERRCRLAPDWLRQATSFRFEGEIPVLLDDQGREVARLLPGAKPTPGPHVVPSLAEPPMVTPEVRQAFTPAVGLPPHLKPASRDDLRGRWVPVGPARGSAHVELRNDGEWRGSDGCNGQHGRWVAGPDGALLATAGPSTLIGCRSVPVATWLSEASRAGLDGEVLVLLTAKGTETGRLARG